MNDGHLTTLLDLGPDGPDTWRDQAVCAQVDPEAFYPEKGGTTRQAKAVCNGTGGRPPCPVRDECLAFAMANSERFGIWGGMSPKERRALARQPAQETPARRGGWKWADDTVRARVADLAGRGMTPEDIAAEVGVSSRTVYRIQARQRLQRGAA